MLYRRMVEPSGIPSKTSRSSSIVQLYRLPTTLSRPVKVKITTF